MWLFVLAMVTATVKAEFDYCTITKKHTMCNSDQGFGDKCGTVLGSGITNQDRQEIVRVHNELRSEIANGRERRGKPGPQPPAANMEQMVISFHTIILEPFKNTVRTKNLLKQFLCIYSRGVSNRRKLDLVTSRMAFLDLNLHVLQLVTSNSNKRGRSVVQKCTSDTP